MVVDERRGKSENINEKRNEASRAPSIVTEMR